MFGPMRDEWGTYSKQGGPAGRRRSKSGWRGSSAVHYSPKLISVSKVDLACPALPSPYPYHSPPVSVPPLSTSHMHPAQSGLVCRHNLGAVPADPGRRDGINIVPVMRAGVLVASELLNIRGSSSWRGVEQLIGGGGKWGLMSIRHALLVAGDKTPSIELSLPPIKSTMKPIAPWQDWKSVL